MKKNIFYLFIVQVSNYIFPLISLPYLVRTLGVTNYGYLMLAQALIQYLILITDYGFNFSATKRIALAKAGNEIDAIFTATINAKLILSMACLIFLVVVISCVPMYQDISLTCLILSLGVIGNSLFPIFLFQGIEKMKNITWITVLARCIMLIFMFIFVKHSDDVNKAAWSLTLALALPGGVSLYLIKKWGLAKYHGFSFTTGYEAIKDSTPLFLSQIAISFYTIFNIVLIGHILGPVQVGIFSAADKLRGAVQSLFNPIQQVVFPRMNKDKQNITIKLKRYGGIFLTATFLICIIIFFIGDKVALYFFGKDFLKSAFLFKWMSVSIFIVSCAIVISQWGLIVLGKEKILPRVYIIGAVLHFIYSPIMTKYYGVIGTLTAVIITEFIITVIMGSALLVTLKSRR